MTICPKHRREFTLDWLGRKSTSCSYPSHSGKIQQMKTPRRVNLEMSKEIFAKYQVSVPVGSAICSKCRTVHYKARHFPHDASSDINQQSTSGLPSTSGVQLTPDPPSSNVAMTAETLSTSKFELETVATQSPLTMTITEEVLPVSHGTEVETISSQLAMLKLKLKPCPPSPLRVQLVRFQKKKLASGLMKKEDQQEKRQTLNNSMQNISDGRVSPLLSTLNTEWDDISSTQQRYYTRKAREMFAATLSVISPGQEDHLWDSIRREPLISWTENEKSGRKYFDTNSALIDSLIKAHNQAESWQTKRQMLSLFSNDFSRSELQSMIPGLSKWRIDQARNHATQLGKGQPLLEKPIYRARIDNAKVDHFLDFISRPEFLQDVAFGTKTLKLDSGENIVIPAVVRTLIPSRIIQQYKQYCYQEQFEPTSDRSLYRILDVCGASMQRSLAGLDNVTADGTEAIDNLINIVQTLVENGGDKEWGVATEKQVKEVKRYFKTDFKPHMSREEHCADHCMTHALSDDKKPEFQTKCKHKHDVECERCESLEVVLDEIRAKINSADIRDDQRNRMKFDFDQCQAAIYAWKAHLVRTVLQEEAKQAALNNLDSETCLIIVDWAMKFLPLKFRENMCEFFGKRGRSWHVSAVVTKKDGKFEVECFVHILNSCTQDSYAIASIFDHLFRTIKAEYPSINKAYLRSDNAGCYHNGPLLLCLDKIGESTGITPIRYDFSDPQAGKDICDRKIAPMKAHIRRFVNEGNDVVTAEDMKRALESYVKAYLIEKFQAGEISGTKADPLSVSREMKSKKDEKGELVFQPDEWKTAQTIKSFFSRYRAKLRQQQIGSQSEEEDEIAEEDMEALEAETDLQDLRSEVYSDLRKPEHPIEVDGINVCHLVQKKKLMSLKVRELTAICETIGIPIEGPKGKKKTFIKPLEDLVQRCSCVE
ncbi:hypothetical protein AC249_AIPGENE28663 [Exaiptasia diaphana]|nr:hypothetical protein AC249_AIPGENE28663 [Exaiptasia diaphana]